MTTPWLSTSAPPSGPDGAVVLVEGTTFCVGDLRGDLGRGPTGGLFVRDTRVLTSWRLDAHRRLDPLRVHRPAPFAATFVLHAPPTPHDHRPDVLLVRERLLGDGLREVLTVRNEGARPVPVRLDLQVGADFADLFEVKEQREPPPFVVRVQLLPGGIDLSTVRHGEEYGVTVTGPAGTRVDERGLHWETVVAPRGSWSATVLVSPRLRGRRLVPDPPRTAAVHRDAALRSLGGGAAPRLRTGDATLARTLERSIEDLGTLRIADPARPEDPVVAAGAPWFMALFGRDSLLTSMMVLPFDHTLALGSLRTLGGHLGTAVVPVTDEQPGRVPHELRFGPAADLALGGRHAYYGSADATPLFVWALGELHRWQPAVVGPELLALADRALGWVRTHGDPDRDGFVECAPGTPQGLLNQGWKDSHDAVNHADGRLAEPPVALAEVQAYVYAAHLARARIAEDRGDPETAAICRHRAERLRTAFHEAFWLADRGWYAAALDRHKRPVDALSSTNGHCLWSGIAFPEQAAEVAGHLGSAAMSSGWGLRTLSSEMGAYHPLSYHNGSVWPHDTAIAVAGLLRYGHVAPAHDLALGLLDAAAEFGHRLPELFGGYARRDVPVPVPYPAACSPQAWASAAPIEVLRALLGLAPSPSGLLCRPVLPPRLLPLALERVPCGNARYDVVVDETSTVVRPSSPFG